MPPPLHQPASTSDPHSFNAEDFRALLVARNKKSPFNNNHQNNNGSDGAVVAQLSIGIGLGARCKYACMAAR